MPACADVELIAVPRADDVTIRSVECEPCRCVRLIHIFDHTRQNGALAYGSALVRTNVQVSINSTIEAEQTDRLFSHVHNQPALFRYGGAFAHSDRAHGFIQYSLARSAGSTAI